MFYENDSTYVWVFSVGRGLSCFIKLGCGYGIMYDIGKASEFESVKFIDTNIKPHLRKHNGRCFAQLILSHPHADHISQIEDLNQDDFYLITGPNDKCKGEEIDYSRVNNPSNASNLVDEYKKLYANRNPPLQTIVANCSTCSLEYGIFYFRPPEIEKEFPDDDQLYTNSTSLILYIKHNDSTVLIPGDITPEIFERILNDEPGTEKRYSILKTNSGSILGKLQETPSEETPSLGKLLRKYGLTFLVAPHHGLESGFCDALFKNIKDNKVYLNIISERKHREGDNSGEIDKRYQSKEYSRGIDVYTKTGESQIKHEKRYSISTVTGDHILIKLEESSTKAVIAKDPSLLLN